MELSGGAGVLSRVIQTLNQTDAAALRAAADATLRYLLDMQQPLHGEHEPSVVDAVSLLVAPAWQQRLTADAFEDLLSSTTSLRSDALRTVADAYRTAFSDSLLKQRSAHDDDDGASCLFDDGYFPRLTGASWSLQHALGDRMRDPPTRSLPQFTLRLDVDADSAGSSTEGERLPQNVTMMVPAERLDDLYGTLRDMLKEAERVVVAVSQMAR